MSLLNFINSNITRVLSSGEKFIEFPLGLFLGYFAKLTKINLSFNGFVFLSLSNCGKGKGGDRSGSNDHFFPLRFLSPMRVLLIN